MSASLITRTGLALLLAGICTAGPSVTMSFAEPAERGAEETAALADAQARYDEARSQLKTVGSQLEAAQVQISKLKKDLSDIELGISDTQQQIQRITAELTTAQAALAAFLQIGYKASNLNILDVVFASHDFNDYVTRRYYMASIQDALVQTIDDIKALKVQLEEQQVFLADQQGEKSDLLKLVETQEQSLAIQKGECDRILASLSQEVQDLFAAQQAELQAAAAARAAAADAAAQGEAIGLFAPGTSRGSVVENAYACLGIPYVWGGDDLDFAELGGYDCSGFVQHCYALEGYFIGRTTWDQIADIQYRNQWKENLEDLVPGDLVFPSEGHVGIYIGDGQMINAPYPGTFIQIDPVEAFIGGGSPV